MLKFDSKQAKIIHWSNNEPRMLLWKHLEALAQHLQTIKIKGFNSEIR